MWGRNEEHTKLMLQLMLRNIALVIKEISESIQILHSIPHTPETQKIEHVVKNLNNAAHTMAHFVKDVKIEEHKDAVIHEDLKLLHNELEWMKSMVSSYNQAHPATSSEMVHAFHDLIHKIEDIRHKLENTEQDLEKHAA